MREWYSLVEILGLPGLVGSKAGLLNKAKSENWRYRPRKARGGGNEYHIASLPEETRNYLIDHDEEHQRNLKALQSQMMRESLKAAAHAYANETRLLELNEAGHERLGHRITVLRAWYIFTQELGKSKSVTSHFFAELYNSGQIDLPPAVYSAISSVSGPSLLRWEAQARKDGSARLGGKYGNRKGKSIIDDQPELQQFVIGMLYYYPHASSKHVYDAIKARFSDRSDIKLPAARSVQRWMSDYEADNKQVLTAVRNPDEWKNKYMVAHGSMSKNIERLNQLWEFDSTPADIMLNDGRHAIIGVIDVYSRRFKLHVSKTSKATAIAALTRRCLLEWGVPETAKTDNGADYVGFHMQRVFTDLSIKQELCPPFQPWRKPHIERAFHTFSHGLLELMPGFIGHNVAERQSLEARHSFADRLFKKNDLVELKMTAAQLQEFCDTWTDSIYGQQPHAGLNKRAPFDLVAAYTGEIKTIKNERALDILLAEAPENHGRRTVHKKGIRIKWVGEPQSHWYSSAELGLHVGEELRVHYDPTDEMGQIYVFNDDGFVCIAECPELLGIDRKEHAALAKAKQQQFVNDGRAVMKQAAKDAGTESIAEEIMARSVDQTKNVALFPKPSSEHSSEFLVAANTAVDSSEKTIESVVTTEQRERLMRDMQLPQKSDKPQTGEDRMKRWFDIDGRINAGETVSVADEKFHQVFRTTHEFSARHGVIEDFNLWAKYGLEKPND